MCSKQVLSGFDDLVNKTDIFMQKEEPQRLTQDAPEECG